MDIYALEADMSQKMAFRELMFTIPRNSQDSQSDVISAERWLTKAADLYRSLEISDRVLREAWESRTNGAAASLKTPSLQILTTVEQRERFVELLKTAAHEPTNQPFLNGSGSDRYPPYGALHQRWPQLAVAELVRRFEQNDAVSRALGQALIQRSWLDGVKPKSSGF
jgi:hypothetical protein